MIRTTAAAFIFVSGNACVGIGETPDAARESLAHEIDVAALPADTCEGESPRLALVDDLRAPTEWQMVEEFYRVIDRTVGAEVGEGDSFFSDEDEAIAAAESLDDVGFDCEVRAFSRPTRDTGRVVWGA